MTTTLADFYRNTLIEVDRMRVRMVTLCPSILDCIDTYRRELQKALHTQGVRP